MAGFMRSRHTFAFALCFEQRLAFEQHTTQSFKSFRSRFLPKLAPGRLQQPLSDRVQSPGVGGAKEIAHLLRERIVLGQSLVDEVRRNLRGRIEAEDVVDRRCQFQSTFVAMPLDALNPLWIDHARTIDAQSLFFKIADLGRIGPRAIAEIRLGLGSRQGADGSDHASVELEIIVGVEDVVLAIVLIVQRHLNRLQTFSKHRPGIHPVRVLAVRIATPLQKHSGEVLVAFPVAGFDQGQNARAIRTGLRAKHAIACLRLCLVRRQIRVLLQIGQVMLAGEILLQRLVLLR